MPLLLQFIQQEKAQLSEEIGGKSGNDKLKDLITLLAPSEWQPFVTTTKQRFNQVDPDQSQDSVAQGKQGRRVLSYNLHTLLYIETKLAIDMCADDVYVHNEAPRGRKCRTVLMKTNFSCFVSLNMLLKGAPDLEDLQNILTRDLVLNEIKCDLLPAKERCILLQKEF